MKLLITGATGMVGSALVELCHKNDIGVHYLTTSKGKIEQQPGYTGFYWNPAEGVIDPACLDGVDGIINLAGASIAQRWTDEAKKEILQSRTRSLSLLKQLLEDNDHGVKALVSASAVGIYPSSKTRFYEEDFSGSADTFTATVVNAWEQSADEIASLGIPVAKLRIGLVLSDEGGALVKMAKPVRYYAGAAFGDGEQWQSWIHIDDLAEMFLHAVKLRLEGVYNAVAPNPVTNQKLTQEIAAVLKKPLILPNIPEAAMKLVLGEMASILFVSHRVCSRKIEDTGFFFHYVNIIPALQDLLKEKSQLKEELA
ncbi:TIGR01777 family oxidoreductase [Robertkochia aurantiaca]|uniref:TIGR01777 family oxidoreductase n=1 Tax=Robertkochia aurantiaca TaxID=2873700 RepID=UPI001CCA152C|nr:TIGR01777 family oxidoreductase [Robertkochia sp. 3YJGBD-33]